jgi:hypothetical protein
MKPFCGYDNRINFLLNISLVKKPRLELVWDLSILVSVKKSIPDFKNGYIGMGVLVNCVCLMQFSLVAIPERRPPALP